jgi:DNA-binding MarR family transcriptional regulator
MARRPGTAGRQSVDPMASGARDSPFLLPDFLPYRMSVTTNRVSHAFAALYQREFGISIPEWRALAVIGSFAPLSSNEVCERTQMDKTKVSRAIAGLIRRSLAERKTHGADQRLIQLNLTAEGRRVLRAIVPKARALERQITTGFSAREIALLNEFLDRLAQSVAGASAPRADADKSGRPGRNRG